MRSYQHPHPTRYRLLQFGALALLLLILLSVPVQLYAAIVLPAPLFWITAALTLFMTTPVVMYLSSSPGIVIHPDGIELQPIVWKNRFIPWEDILVLKAHPLLPQPEQEVVKRYMRGKRKYQAAEGKILVIRNLPPQYRVAGFFTGERWQPTIAITNRTHDQYSRLLKEIEKHVPVEAVESV